VKFRPSAGFTLASVLTPPVRTISAGAALLLVGCASGYDMKVDAISRPTDKPAPSISYEIHSTDPENPEDSLRFKEAAKFVKTALSGKGMYEAPDPEKADLIINIDYGISPPKPKMETRSEPVYVTVPGHTTYQTVQVGTSKNGTPLYQTVAVPGQPETQYLGDREYRVLVVDYEKYLRLSAHENQPDVEGHPAAEIWTIDITSEGESKNLRKYIPALAAASIDYIGKDTHGQQDIHLKDENVDKDGPIAFVKKGM
jgi:hypothetical protein